MHTGTNLTFKIGDKVLVIKNQARTDDHKQYVKIAGVIIEAFNAWDKDGDHWQYRIRGNKGEYISFYEDIDEGEITLLDQ